jgi:hypothetical protein
MVQQALVFNKDDIVRLNQRVWKFERGTGVLTDVFILAEATLEKRYIPLRMQGRALEVRRQRFLLREF